MNDFTERSFNEKKRKKTESVKWTIIGGNVLKQKKPLHGLTFKSEQIFGYKINTGLNVAIILTLISS